MPEKVMPGPVSEDSCIREAVCIHTKKIFDSCRDKDCIEDLRVYPTCYSQEVLDRATSVKAGCAELLYAYIDVEPVSFNRGFYTVDVRYFYRITADAFVGTVRPVEITGLAVFDKRVVLFGSEGSAKVFASNGVNCGPDPQALPKVTGPDAVVEAVDPLILGMKLIDVCDCRPCDCGCAEVPSAVAACFPEELTFNSGAHRLYVTLGQFSLIRLERDTQLLMPVYDYCVPEKECACDGGCDCQEDPCDLFRKVQFPVGEFFPPNSITPCAADSYQSFRSSGCCGCGR